MLRRLSVSTVAASSSTTASFRALTTEFLPWPGLVGAHRNCAIDQDHQRRTTPAVRARQKLVDFTSDRLAKHGAHHWRIITCRILRYLLRGCQQHQRDQEAHHSRQPKPRDSPITALRSGGGRRVSRRSRPRSTRESRRAAMIRRGGASPPGRWRSATRRTRLRRGSSRVVPGACGTRNA